MSVARYLRMYSALDKINDMALSRREREERSARMAQRMERVWRMLTPRQRLEARHAREKIPGKAVP